MLGVIILNVASFLNVPAVNAVLYSQTFEQIIGLMGLNVFSLLFGFSALLANSLVAKQPVALSTSQQVSLLSQLLLNMLH